MKKAKPIYIFFVALLLFSACVFVNSGADVGGENGTINLSEYRIGSSDIISLAGEWKFYRAPAAFNLTPLQIREATEFTRLKVPGPWNSELQHGVGFGMYTVQLDLGDTYAESLAILLKGIGTAADIYINDVHYGSIGSVSTDENTAYPESGSKLIQFFAKGNQVDISIKVSNFHHWQGGIWNPVYFGTADQLHDLQNSSLFWESFMIGLLFIMFCYLMFTYFSSTHSVKNLFLALFCLLFLIRSIFVSDMVYSTFFNYLHRDVFNTIVYIDIYLLIPCSMLYINAMFPEDSLRHMHKASILISFLFICAEIILPTVISTRLMPFYQILILIFLLMSGSVVVKAVKNRRFGANPFLYGFIMLVVLVLNSILITRHVFYSLDLTVIGIVMFILFQIIIITKEYTVLHESKKEAEIAAETKTLFLANMSHEIRTPMNIIIGMNYLLNQTELSEQQQDYLNKSKLASEGLLSVIDDILDISKMEAGKLKIESIALSICNIIRNQQDLFSRRAEEKGISFRTETETDIPDVLIGDPFRLNQILSNLISNAIKFTQDGEVSVRVVKISEDDFNIMLGFEVKDSGIGMSEKQQEHLFESFHQADSSTTRMYGGTGLGLAICKSLAGLLSGSISMRSAPGIGTTFIVELPFKKTESFEQISSELALDVPSEYLKDKKVLLVEDNKLNQQIAREMMMQKGLLVEIADNGKLAIEALKQNTYDIVFMDVQMPVLDGYQTTIKIRKHKKHANLPIIAMTAHTMKASIDSCFEAGMNDFISKPIDPERLFEILAKWLEYPGPSERPKKDTAEADDVQELKPYEDEVLQFDPGLALQRLGNDNEFLLELLSQFLQLYSDTAAQFTSLLENNEMEELEDTAHTIKGMAASIGALRVSAIAAKIENSIRDDDMSAVSELVSDFRREFDEVFILIQEYVENKGSGTI